MQTLEPLIVESPLFEGLQPAHLELITGCAKNVRFAPGEQLFREGEPADTFYLVRHGQVSIEMFVPSRGGVRIETHGEGDVVGWSWLLPPYRWHFDARALDTVRALAFDGECLRGKCVADHELGYELFSRFSSLLVQEIEMTRLRLLDVYGRLPAS
ncbi:MAG TPA: cyclic nucleotide-binding domain-containing protein [Gaiellaceae bacterium]|nr:cyclic nucleotide-binding domain-containing protein [Gaiellaceae bacterium]